MVCVLQNNLFEIKNKIYLTSVTTKQNLVWQELKTILK